MSDSFEVTYGIDDGYVGNGKHTFEIREDYFDEGDNLADLFWDFIETDFEQTVHTFSDQEDEFVAWAEGVIAKRK